MKKKILITGSNGFLGNLAKEYFIKNYDLVFVDITISNDINFYRADISNFSEIDNVISKEKPHIILHFASEIFDTHDKKKIYKTNVDGSENIKKSAIKNNIENLIFTSTFSLFEKNYDYLISENEPISCKNYYGVTKFEVENILLKSEDPNIEDPNKDKYFKYLEQLNEHIFKRNTTKNTTQLSAEITNKSLLNGNGEKWAKIYFDYNSLERDLILFCLFVRTIEHPVKFV